MNVAVFSTKRYDREFLLARKHGTTTACPLTTGIFAWIAAHAAGEAETTPY